MHELSIASSLVESVLDFASTPPPKKVLKVLLQVGELTCVEPDQLQFCYSSIIPETAISDSHPRDRARPGAGLLPQLRLRRRAEILGRRAIGRARRHARMPPTAAKPPKPPTATIAPSGPSAMSNNNGSSHSAPVDDLVREGRRIQELVEKIGALPDPAARDMLQETLETVLSFYGHGLQRILDLLKVQDAQENQALTALLADPGVSGLLLIHGLHPVPLADRLQAALDKVRPYMESHGGNVELVSLEDDHATLRLRGHCETCPSSTVTLELAVRAAIEEACPDLAGFEVEGLADKSAKGFQHVPAAAPEWTRIEAATSIAEGGFIHVATDVEPLFVCKSGGQLYAYRDQCPACNLPLHLGEMNGGLIVCSLGHRFDVRRAGESPDDSALHLDPLPLLMRDGAVKVALAHGAISGHDIIRP